jgi:predicted RNase H-like HicB family nuclease
MSKVITLPSGATAKIKDPKTLKVKDRKRVLKASEVEGGDLTKAMALSDSLIAMLVEEWSFDLLIPAIKVENLDELDMADYDALVEQTKEAQEVLFPSLAKTDENEKNPKATTADSNG